MIALRSDISRRRRWWKISGLLWTVIYSDGAPVRL